MENKKTGTLYVVATPIGNLQDITLRAIEVLKQVDRIAAEDTRHSTPLLKHFSIHKPIFSLHGFNEQERADHVLQYIEKGESIALISDAGTPLISDPGFYLVREARMRGMTVIPIPGACAAIAALCAAGLPPQPFSFEGFPPAKTEARRHFFAELSHETRTMIFYEAPHRLLSTISTMIDTFGDKRRAVIAKEITKWHESFIFATLKDHFKQLTALEVDLRGEWVIVAEGVDKNDNATCEVRVEYVLDSLLAELPLKQAVTLASKITGERKNKFYEMALKKKQEE